MSSGMYETPEIRQNDAQKFILRFPEYYTILAILENESPKIKINFKGTELTSGKTV